MLARLQTPSHSAIYSIGDGIIIFDMSHCHLRWNGSSTRFMQIATTKKMGIWTWTSFVVVARPIERLASYFAWQMGENADWRN
jgi:hypothetical protein